MYHPDWPELLCPFPSALNPAALAAQSATAAWAQRMGLIASSRSAQRFDRAQYGVLMARAYPNAHPDDLQLIADWNTWLFAVDDQSDEAGVGRDPQRLSAFFDQLAATLHGAPAAPGAGPVLQGAADIARRLRGRGDPAWLARLLQRFGDYCAANVWEATNRGLRRVPSVAEYTTMRMHTGAVYCYLTLIELAERLRLPDAVLAQPALRRLETLTNQAICWSNDLISCEKEARRGDVHNLVLILQHAEGRTMAEAQARVAQRYNAVVEEFVRAQGALPTFGPALDGAVARYVAGMRCWVSANLDWSATTIRYAASGPAPASLTPLALAS